MTMYAIASVLNMDENKAIHEIWDDLEEKCGLKGVKFSPIPHFSWFTFQDVSDLESFEQDLFQCALSFAPFIAKTIGLGIFPGEHPVAYLPIVRNQLLTSMHAGLLATAKPYVKDIPDFYSSTEWMPHITLAFRDLTPLNIVCLIERCFSFNLKFDLYVDHIAILYMDELSFGLKYKFDFGVGGLSYDHGRE
jgi:hypothetical protein